MTRNKKIGITLIAVGLSLPLALLAFVSGYQDGAGFISNLLAIKIMVTFSEKAKIGIPYRFVLAIGVALIFFGIRSIDMGKTRSKEDDDSD